MEGLNEKNVYQTGQYLTFTLGGEVYAIEISKVREVIDFSGVTKLPGTPEYSRGVLNLRGSVVPVIDLHTKFGMGVTKKTVNTCVIIIEVRIEREVAQLGALADSVQEVVDLDEGQIEVPPRIGMNLESSYIQGMGKKGEQFIIILNTNELFSAEMMTENSLNKALIAQSSDPEKIQVPAFTYNME